jgi:DNA adenine methylase
MLKNLKTPLRYPGGKRRLSGLLERLLCSNNLTGCVYAEPYAGGAGLALELLKRECVSEIWLNDVDKGLYAFWHSVLTNTDRFCDLVEDTPVTMDEWFHQKSLLEDSDELVRGFSVFFLNRTNRSGIIKAGVIGGKRQTGKWKVDCRFNKDDLIQRIRAIASVSERIRLFNLDALDFIDLYEGTGSSFGLLNLDPPYYVKGRSLYLQAYSDKDHISVSQRLRRLNLPWVVFYDNTEFIRGLYEGLPFLEFDLCYSAHYHTSGCEIAFFGNLKEIPTSPILKVRR